MPIIETNQLCKDFLVSKRGTGFINTLRSLFFRKYEVRHAVEDVSFNVEKGEMVGYIGPNGAGKSTTIKMLAGILYPTSGEVRINGIIPQKNRKANAMQIGVVFGQRSQLFWDLPAMDTFYLYKKMYKVDNRIFKQNIDFFIEILDMKDFLNTPVRQLSLGQKMRAEFSVAFLHNPDIVFLDEPTIGLDVLAKRKIRSFLKHVNKERNTTMILTTHDMDDIEEICQRLILIDKGKIQYNGEINAFRSIYSDEYTISFFSNRESDLCDKDWLKNSDIIVSTGERGEKTVSFNRSQHSKTHVMRLLMENYDIQDFTIKEPRIEDILVKMYTAGNR